MGSNFNRAMTQNFGPPAAAAACAIPTWAVSASMAQHVLFQQGGFFDFWLAACAIITGLGAVGLTGFAVIAGLIAVYESLQA